LFVHQIVYQMGTPTPKIAMTHITTLSKLMRSPLNCGKDRTQHPSQVATPVEPSEAPEQLAYRYTETTPSKLRPPRASYSDVILSLAEMEASRPSMRRR
jgi:hypothetical protein